MRFEDLVFLWTTRRMSMFLLPGILLKYIVIIENVIQAGNHMNNDIQQGGELNVPPSVGFLHH